MGQPQKNRRAKGQPLLGRLTAFLRDPRANIAPLMALLLVPLIGAMALAGEVGYANMAQRNQQHAADSAALAAAANDNKTMISTASGDKPSYEVEANAVVAKYSLGNPTVVTEAEQLCPDETTAPGSCYKVTITRFVPFWMAGVVGFRGVDKGDGTRGFQAAAMALAKKRVVSEYYCMVALGSNGITLEGKSAGWELCNARSNGQVKCTSNDFKLVVSPSSKTCSSTKTTSDTYTDPYAALDLGTKILTDKNNTTCAPSVASISWVLSQGGSVGHICASTSGRKLTGDLTIPDGKTLIFDGTNLDLNGWNLVANSNATLVFTGSPSPTWITNTNNSKTSTVTVAGPTSGTYGNFAIVDDPNMSSPTNFDPKGDHAKLDLNVLGTIYATKRNLIFDGNISSLVGGYTCLAIVALSIDSNGGKFTNGNPTADCTAAGYTPPKTPPVREALVQ